MYSFHTQKKKLKKPKTISFVHIVLIQLQGLRMASVRRRCRKLAALLERSNLEGSIYMHCMHGGDDRFWR